jgi:hypothetical protein
MVHLKFDKDTYMLGFENSLDSIRFYKFFGVIPCDRTGTLEGIINTINTVPTNEDRVTYANVTFQECVDMQLEKIKTHPMKDIVLLWSGGIDSTVAFYALVSAGIEFSVCMSPTSVKEYPMLAEQIQNDVIATDDRMFPTLLSYAFIKEMPEGFLDNKLIVTGEIGDQLVGSILMLNYTDEQRHMPYTEVLDSDVYRLFDDVIKNLVNTNSLTLGEFLWGMNFIFKYQDVLNRIPNKSFFGTNSIAFNFFDSIPFQVWSINNYKQNANFDKQTDYKKAYKQYIYDVNNDEIYFRYKRKVGSLAQITS